MMGRKAVTEHTPRVKLFIVLTDQKMTDCSDKMNDRKVKAETEFVLLLQSFSAALSHFYME